VEVIVFLSVLFISVCRYESVTVHCICIMIYEHVCFPVRHREMQLNIKNFAKHILTELVEHIAKSYMQCNNNTSLLNSDKCPKYAMPQYQCCYFVSVF